MGNLFLVKVLNFFLQCCHARIVRIQSLSPGSLCVKLSFPGGLRLRGLLSSLGAQFSNFAVFVQASSGAMPCHAMAFSFASFGCLFQGMVRAPRGRACFGTYFVLQCSAFFICALWAN